MAERAPADIARETLKLLATRRLAPTPANYQAVYEEVAGLLPQLTFPKAPLRRIVAVLPTQTAAQKRITRDFTQAVENEDWIALQSAIADFAKLDLGNTSAALPTPSLEAVELVPVMPEGVATQLARAMESTITALGEEDERMREISQQLVTFLQSGPPPLSALEQMLANYSYRLSFTAQDQAQRRRSIHDLLRMVCEHILSTASQDTKLQRQATALTEAMQSPWTLRQLDTIQTHLKNLLFRHLEIESNRSDAHQQLKDLLAIHTQQMTGLGKLSEQHASQLQNCAAQIQSAQDLGDLTSALEAVVQSGHALATENRIVQAQLADLQAQTEVQAQTIETLSSNLAQVEDSTRHDPETGALNEQGLQEALLTEAARNRRHTQPTSLAALRIDPLSDHETDAPSAALVHLARLVRSTLRPQDALGRINAQQFVLVFPGTEPAQTAQALARLQTELSRRPLLLDEQYIPISFSAGVIALSGLDTPAEALERAVQACEQAQRMGTRRIALY